VLIKLAEYASQLGVVPQAVRKAIAEGRIKDGATREGRSWLIDPEVADREWGKNTMPQRRHSAEIKAGRQRQLNGGGESDSSGGHRGPSMNQAQTIKAGYQAKLLALEYEERSGKLVSVEEMTRKRFESGRQVRDAVLRIGPQMIGEIAKAAGGLNPDERAEVLLVIQRHLVNALEALADGAGQG
jgi:hypothetical protein